MTNDEKQIEKQPLGATPFYITSSIRIRELSDAINRYSSESNKTSLIRMWASEIILQCELMEKMRGET